MSTWLGRDGATASSSFSLWPCLQCGLFFDSGTRIVRWIPEKLGQAWYLTLLLSQLVEQSGGSRFLWGGGNFNADVEGKCLTVYVHLLHDGVEFCQLLVTTLQLGVHLLQRNKSYSTLFSL